MVLGLLLSGCAPTSYITSKGKLQVRVDPLVSSTYTEIKASADKLCSEYNKGSATNLRKTGGSSLTWYYYEFDCSKGSPKIAESYSSNSSSSSLSIALQRERDAKKRAQQAEWAAADAERRAQEAEAMANWQRLNCGSRKAVGYNCY